MCVLRLMDSMVVDSDKHDNMIPWVWSKELGSVKKKYNTTSVLFSHKENDPNMINMPYVLSLPLETKFPTV